jgi:hypothetical protein
VWELNENSTTLDIISAAPSDEYLVHAWWSWAVVAILVGLASLIVGLGILTSRRARRNPFNMYLVYLAIPDFVFSFSCGITCLLNAINREYWSEWMCSFQNWYAVFGIGSNAWINACIMRELYRMLRSGERIRRYNPPSRKYVTAQALAVYLCMGCLGVWGLIEAPSWPFYSETRSGLACLPVVRDKESTIVFWLVFLPLFAGIPTLYIIFLSIEIWRRKLLPRNGRRRLLVVYFARLILVFYIMWLPTLFTLFILSQYMSPTANYVGGLWSHLQGAVSAAVSLLKPDVYSAVRSFVTCQPEVEVPTGSARLPRTMSSHWSGLGSTLVLDSLATGGVVTDPQEMKVVPAPAHDITDYTEEPASKKGEGRGLASTLPLPSCQSTTPREAIDEIDDEIDEEDSRHSK